MPQDILFHPGAGWQVFYPTNGSLSKVLQTVKASSKGSFNVGWIYNANATVCYLQVFDFALASEVTVGTTSATFNIPIAPSLWDKPVLIGYNFKKGCHLAFTTTKNGSTDAGTALDAAFLFNAY